MADWEISRGRGRTRVRLSVKNLRDDLLVTIFNESAHIGAVAVGEYSHEEKRTSTSVITRLGHKDDAVALKAAYNISRATQKTCCVVAGIHLDDITPGEIGRLVKNAGLLVTDLLRILKTAA